MSKVVRTIDLPKQKTKAFKPIKLKVSFEIEVTKASDLLTLQENAFSISPTDIMDEINNEVAEQIKQQLE